MSKQIARKSALDLAVKLGIFNGSIGIEEDRNRFFVRDPSRRIIKNASGLTDCENLLEGLEKSIQTPELNWSSFDDIPAREYIVDSGASFHLVNRDDLTSQELKTKRRIKPIRLSTANGIVVVNHKVRIFVHTLGIYVWAILHRSTPNLLSQGSLVKDEKYNYTHKHGECPYLEKDGHRYYCPVRENTPIIVAGTDDGPVGGDVDLKSEPEQDSFYK